MTRLPSQQGEHFTAQIRRWADTLRAGGVIQEQRAAERAYVVSVVRYVNGLGPDPSHPNGAQIYDEVTHALTGERSS